MDTKPKPFQSPRKVGKGIKPSPGIRLGTKIGLKDLKAKPKKDLKSRIFQAGYLFRDLEDTEPKPGAFQSSKKLEKKVVEEV